MAGGLRIINQLLKRMIIMKFKPSFYLLMLAIFITLVSTTGCHDEPVVTPAGTGRITLDFAHMVNNVPLQTDTLQYVNAAGNQYMITEIQYFISDVTLYRSDGTIQPISHPKDIHYVDYDIPSTWTWEVADSIPEGIIDSISFTFGINEEKNVSGLFTDPPESLMFWPDMMGGGYHYMKMNGKWLDTLAQLSPFNFHLGIGQIYDEEGNITGFVQNYFRVSLPNSFFLVEKDRTECITIIMNIESWFDSPHVWDHNKWGGAIMMNQGAMQQAKENGFDVFSASVKIDN
jgi:hypothetical protein